METIRQPSGDPENLDQTRARVGYVLPIPPNFVALTASPRDEIHAVQHLPAAWPNLFRVLRLTSRRIPR